LEKLATDGSKSLVFLVSSLNPSLSANATGANANHQHLRER
jgi:hypothetical protein